MTSPGTNVSSSFKNVRVEFIDITSEKGGPLVIINPWRDGKISMLTEPGKQYHVTADAN